MFLGAVSMDFVHLTGCFAQAPSATRPSAPGRRAGSPPEPLSARRVLLHVCPSMSPSCAVGRTRTSTSVRASGPQRARALTRSVLFLSRTKGGPQIAYERSFRWKLAHFRYLCQVLQW